MRCISFRITSWMPLLRSAAQVSDALLKLKVPQAGFLADICTLSALFHLVQQ